jgi:glycosyltransferase involved in cell wall biosynthesis
MSLLTPSRALSPADSEAIGFRVVIDLRPLQQPNRSPITAAYLRNLLRGFEANPVEDEEFVALLQAGLPDPTEATPDLPVISRRWLPPTRAMRAGALTLDPLMLRGASIAAGRGSTNGCVYHVAGSGSPLGSRMPVVATVLDLAPWELPHVFQANPAASFGERLRARVLRQAGGVIVGTHAVAKAATRLLHLEPDRVHVVPLAADTKLTGMLDDPQALAAWIETERALLDLPDRYLLFYGRYDARTDLPTLLDALALLDDRPRPEVLGAGIAWPPQLVLAATTQEDREALARAAERRGLAQKVHFAPHLPEDRLAGLIAGARASLRPTVSDAAGMAAIEAIACGTPVVASGIGALPEIVGGCGVIVESRDPARLARAIDAIWSDDKFHAQLRDGAIKAARTEPTWGEIAAMTRAVYRSAAARAVEPKD